jgi:hypothetical protein
LARDHHPFRQLARGRFNTQTFPCRTHIGCIGK